VAQDLGKVGTAGRSRRGSPKPAAATRSRSQSTKPAAATRSRSQSTKPAVTSRSRRQSTKRAPIAKGRADKASFGPLSEILANRRWVLRKEPFPHVVATEVFVPEFAAALDAACVKVLAEERLQHFGWYDAHSWSFSESMSGPLRVFISPEWCAMVASVLGVAVSGHVATSIHHHDVGTAHGFPHNDYNPVYFPRLEQSARAAGGGRTRKDSQLPRPLEVQLSRGDLVGYTTGVAQKPGVEVEPVVRAVALLYYLGNEPWTHGDGGETGLYRRRSDRVDRPAVAVPPRNNSLVAFECTPSSFHSFIANRRHQRNSVIQWLHRTTGEVESRWGMAALERWPS